MKEYNAWNQGDVGGSLSLGNTSKFLQDLGVSQGNVYWDKAKIVASKKNHPDLTDSVMKQVPQLLDDPLLVMQSKTGAKRFAFIDNVLDDHGKPVLAALVLEPTGAGNRVVKFTKIPGVDVRYNALEGLKKSGDVLYQKPGKSMSGMEAMDPSTRWIEGGNNFTKLKESSPIDIPDGAKVTQQSKKGYEQVKYNWSEKGHKYESRWHTRTPGAPETQGNTWVVTKTIPGTPTGQPKVRYVLTTNGWVSMSDWKAAVTARQNGTATAAQQDLLTSGHWPVN